MTIQKYSSRPHGQRDRHDVGIQPSGINFLRKGGYRKESKENWWINAPRRYWWLIAIFTLLLGLFADIIKEEYKRIRSQEPIQQGLLPQQKSDTLMTR